ncbi:MAG: hypothetical protein AAF652_12080 [Cyanobacteria bacterium P01_C01_bin.72]
MEWTESYKQILQETAKALKGASRRRFLPQIVDAANLRLSRTRLRRSIKSRKSFEEIRSVTSLDSLPLIVLSRGSKDSKISYERFQEWALLQLDLTKLSLNSQRIIAENSGHLIQLD